MNETKIENGNSEIPKVEELVIEDGDDAETIKTKVEEYKTKVKDREAKLFARTKRAEGFELVDGKWVKPATPKNEEHKVETTNDSENKLSQSDLIAVVKADLPEEDLSEVIEFATFKKISVAEALKSPTIKSILAEKNEQRKIADGTNTTVTKKGSSKLSDEALASNAVNGKLPETPEDIKRLTEFNLRKSKK